MDIYHKIFTDKFIDKECRLLILTNKDIEDKSRQIMEDFLKLENMICAFDMEFNQKNKKHVLYLFQVGLFFPDCIELLFIDINTLSSSTEQLLKEILIRPDVTKIGHGTDSLDLPTIHKFLNDDILCLSFINSLYDTRMICEYINTYINEKKCNVYHCLEKYSVIDNDHLEYLKSVELDNHYFWFRQVTLHTMKDTLIDYAIYDTIYLSTLLSKMKKYIKHNNLNFNLIVEITRFSYNVKENLIENVNFNDMNIWLYNGVQLKSSFDQYYDEYLQTANTQYSNILLIGVLKRFIQPVFLASYYIIMLNNFKINITNKKIVTENIIKQYNDQWLAFVDKICVYSHITLLIKDFTEKLIQRIQGQV